MSDCVSARRFQTDFVFRDRASKARYVWLKYRPILAGRILDVGADECQLRRELPEGCDYTGVGAGGSPDVELNLEAGRLPFGEGEFDCVLCLDVLEHLESAHAVFDELCRVSRRWVIVSLPNAYRDFWALLRSGDYRPGVHLKFYGLPVEPPADRHRWFFTRDEALAFVKQRAKRNGLHIVEWDLNPPPRPTRGWRGLLERLALRALVHPGFDLDNLRAGALWAVLEKPGAE